MNLTQNVLFTDNVSESIFEIESEGLESQGMLLATVKHGREKYQVHLFVTRNEDDFIDFESEMPVLKYSDGDLTVIKP